MKQLCVLLSTYNGEKYISDQLDSIFSQEVPNCKIKVLIRDDASTDDTVKICREYAEKNEYDIDVIEGENVRTAKSFLKLVAMCPEADYYAFCDQDDIWIPGKINAAVHELDSELPSLWISNYHVVDEKLNVIVNGALKVPESNPLKILFYNNVPGCVMMFNLKLLNEIRELRIYDFRMHDILVLDIAQITGRVVFEEKAYVLYRQHGNNVLGFGNKKIKPLEWCRNKVNYLHNKEDYHIRDYARVVAEKYGSNMPRDVKNELCFIADYRNSIINRFRLLKKPYTKDGFNRTALSIRWKILLGVF